MGLVFRRWIVRRIVRGGRTGRTGCVAGETGRLVMGEVEMEQMVMCVFLLIPESFCSAERRVCSL
jgi:hypothetical protein